VCGYGTLIVGGLVPKLGSVRGVLGGVKISLLPTKWHLDPSRRLATTDMGRKLGAVPLWGGEAGFPSNTMWPGPRPTSVPNGILIYPAVLPQKTWAADYMDARKACARKFRKWGGCCALSVSPHLTQCGRGRGLPACQVSSGSI